MQACLKKKKKKEKKRNSFLYFFWKENSLEMFCLRNTNLFDSPFKVLHKTVSDSWREMRQKTRLHIPSEWWKQFLKRRKRIVGIVPGCNSKWKHWKEQRFKGQGGGRWGPDRLYLKPSVPPWVPQSRGVASPSGRWHSGPFFLSDILMASFMEISHFPVRPRERRCTLFLSKGYRQGNTSALMLCSVFKAGRTQEDGNYSVRSCKNECQKENESGIGNELCILWDPCVCKGFVSYHPPPSLSPPPLLSLLFPRWSWVRGWAAAWGGKSARLKLSFWHCMKPSWQPFQVTTPRCNASYISRLLFTPFNQIAHH